MQKFVLSIAGFDPSGGAGVLADIKTFEQNGVQGLGVCTAITFQRDDYFDDVQWIPFKKIKKQLDVLLEKYEVQFCKIGLIKSEKVLLKLIRYLKEKEIKIIFDPILKASAGYNFRHDPKALKKCMKDVYLITPNKKEFEQIFGQKSGLKKAMSFSKKTNLLLKGGHNKKNKGVDILFSNNKTSTLFPRKGNYSPKHGSGCIFSAAITAQLAMGNTLYDSCLKGKEYISNVLQSNTSLLGNHAFEFSYSKKIQNTYKNNNHTLQYISQGKTAQEHLENIEAVLGAGCKWIQLRLKNYPIPIISEIGIRVKELCENNNAIFILNDHPNIAKRINADGVHLGKDDMSPLEARKILGENSIIGGTANTIEDIIHLDKEKVNYIGLGPFKFTTTKKKLSPVLGITGYRTLNTEMKIRKIDIPVYAIGGILEHDIKSLKATGVKGIAVSGLLTQEQNKKKLIQYILNELND